MFNTYVPPTASATVGQKQKGPVVLARIGYKYIELDYEQANLEVRA